MKYRIGLDEDGSAAVFRIADALCRRVGDREELDSLFSIARLKRFVGTPKHHDINRGRIIYDSADRPVGLCLDEGPVFIYTVPPLTRDDPELRPILEDWLKSAGNSPLVTFVDARNPESLASWAGLGFHPDGPPAIQPHWGERLLYRLTRTPPATRVPPPTA